MFRALADLIKKYICRNPGEWCRRATRIGLGLLVALLVLSFGWAFDVQVVASSLPNLIRPFSLQGDYSALQLAGTARSTAGTLQSTETPAEGATETAAPSAAVENPTLTNTPEQLITLPPRTPGGTITPLVTPTIPKPIPTLTPNPVYTGTITPTPPIKPTPAATWPPITIDGPYVQDEVIVKFKTGLRNIHRSDVFDVLDVITREEIPELGVWVLSIPEGSVPAAISFLSRSPHVEFAEPNYIAHAYAIPGDPEWGQQSYLHNIQLPQAWDLSTSSPETIIAIIDTGVDTSHPDIKQKVWFNPGEMGEDAAHEDKRDNGVDDDVNGYIDDWQGWNALSNTGQVMDVNGHGTHIAGIAGANTNNGKGIAGVAWQARLMPVKTLADDGKGSYAHISKAIVYAVQQGARIINLSLGGSQYGRLLNLAVNYAYANDVSVIAAAGDTSDSKENFPAAFRNAIAVGATDNNDEVASFSTVGEMVDLYAPGVQIHSTIPGDEYKKYSGTSMAAAHVSGVAALLASRPEYDSAELIYRALLTTAKAITDDPYGPRLVQAYGALLFMNLGTPTPTPTPTEPPGRPLAVYPLAPTADLPPGGPTSTPIYLDPHVNYMATTDSCAGCHRGHSAAGIELRSHWPEERVCFDCHTAGGVGTNVETAFTAYTNTGTAYYSHDIYQTIGTHRSWEMEGDQFGGINRHIECEDCHEPHEATRGYTTPPRLQYEMKAASGVDPVWTVAGAPTDFEWMNSAEREFQICFKCHSSYTILTEYRPDGWNGTTSVANGLYKLDNTDGRQSPDYRDLAIEFNPNNASFHPIITQGRNLAIPAGSFVNGWTVSSLVYCSDCHANANASTQGDGPHGSPLLHLLDGSQNYTTVDNDVAPSSGEICFKCHDYATYAGEGPASSTLFRDEDDNLHTTHTNGESTPCYICHDTHGSEQLHLINFDTSVVRISGVNRDSKNAWEYDGTSGTCFLACHQQGHGYGKSYTP